MGPGQVAACSISLLAAGVLLTRGFIGFVPGRPVFVALGFLLAASAVASLAFDRVTLQALPARPDHVLIDELNRSRRAGHPLSLVSVRCSTELGTQIGVRLRCVDRAWRQRGRLYVMLVETDRVGGEAFVHRVADLVGDREVQLASFPDDAVTMDALYEGLRPTDAHLRALDGSADLMDLPSSSAELGVVLGPVPLAPAPEVDAGDARNGVDRHDLAVGEG